MILTRPSKTAWFASTALMIIRGSRHLLTCLCQVTPHHLSLFKPDEFNVEPLLSRFQPRFNFPWPISKSNAPRGLFNYPDALARRADALFQSHQSPSVNILSDDLSDGSAMSCIGIYISTVGVQTLSMDLSASPSLHSYPQRWFHLSSSSHCWCCWWTFAWTFQYSFLRWIPTICLHFRLHSPSQPAVHLAKNSGVSKLHSMSTEQDPVFYDREVFSALPPLQGQPPCCHPP